MGVSTVKYNIFVTNSFAFSKNLRLLFYSVYIQIFHFQSKFIMRIPYFEVNFVISSLLITNQNDMKRYIFLTLFNFDHLLKINITFRSTKPLLLLPYVNVDFFSIFSRLRNTDNLHMLCYIVNLQSSNCLYNYTQGNSFRFTFLQFSLKFQIGTYQYK